MHEPESVLSIPEEGRLRRLETWPGEGASSTRWQPCSASFLCVLF